MAKETAAQKKTVERVLHEYKEGDLTSGSGDPVKSRKQAIAIALSEAGASNQQSSQANARNRKAAERLESPDAPTKAELYARAKQQDVAGRSRMSKA